MFEKDKEVRADLADEEARKTHAFLWAAEGLLHRAHELAEEAEEQLRGVLSEAPGRPEAG
jgi:hypothetical protein